MERTEGGGTMREVVWTGLVTVDGIMDSPGSPDEGHPFGGWVMRTEYLSEAFAIKEQELEGTSALLLGRRSYEAFAPVWSKSADLAAYQDLPKYVISTTLQEDDLFEGWGETRILRGTADVAALKDEDGGSLFIHGSGELARRLDGADLIDRYHLLVFPVALGDGKRLFEPRASERRLELRDVEAYRNGVVKAIYDVTRT
ncbi:MAG: dihydrofolate reductase family protein [Leucobacter sp.]